MSEKLGGPWDNPQPPATEPWEYAEINRLQERIAYLESELAKLTGKLEEEMAHAFAAVHNAFQKLGFSFSEAKQKATDVFKKEV